jgi:DNA-directed RNA polymerase subunit K/omega
MSDSGDSDNDLGTKNIMLEGDSDDEDFDITNTNPSLPVLPTLEGSTKTGIDMPSMISAQATGLDISDDDTDDDMDDDDESFQKFDKELKEKYLETVHPESLTQNYDEISSLSKVVRDNNGIIIDELHKTLPWLTKYEKTRVLGQRIKQLNGGADQFVKVSANIIDNSIIAQMELEQKKIPFIIRRPIPGGGSEFWCLKDLVIIC